MKREDLISSKEYWLANIQNELFGAIERFMTRRKLNRTKLADELNVTKGYVSQVMNGEYDHRISKMVDLALSCDSVPLVYFVDKSEFISQDANNKKYEIRLVDRNYSTSYHHELTEITNESIAEINENGYNYLRPIIGGQINKNNEPTADCF